VSIEIAGVGKKFGDFVALEGIDLTIPTGQLTALLGPSGGGKSTLLRIIAGLEQADVGRVEIEGTDATHLPARKRGVGFVFQHYAAFKHLSVFRNVAFGLEIRKVPKDEIRRRVGELLELVHLSQFADRLPSQLSGGQRQRMALARALAVEPKVLLLDEPVAGMSDEETERTAELFLSLAGKHSLVVVEHDMAFVAKIARKVTVLHEGSVLAEGDMKTVQSDPRVIEVYLGR